MAGGRGCVCWLWLQRWLWLWLQLWLVGVGVVVSFRAFLISDRRTGSCGLVGSPGGCRGLVVENCTVDASIFDSLQLHVPGLSGPGVCAGVCVFVGVCVVKLLRAHGGCLGTRSR